MAEHNRMPKGEEEFASRRSAESDGGALHETGSGHALAVQPGHSATLVPHVNLGGHGNSGARSQVLLNMQRTHGNRAVQRVHRTHDTSGRAAIQRTPTGILEAMKKHMGDELEFGWPMGITSAPTDAQAVDDARAIDEAQSAITGRPPLESAPPMVPVPALIPDPHKDFPGEGALEYRNVSPELDWLEHPMYGW